MKTQSQCHRGPQRDQGRSTRSQSPYDKIYVHSCCSEAWGSSVVFIVLYFSVVVVSHSLSVFASLLRHTLLIRNDDSFAIGNKSSLLWVPSELWAVARWMIWDEATCSTSLNHNLSCFLFLLREVSLTLPLQQNINTRCLCNQISTNSIWYDNSKSWMCSLAGN